MAEGKLRAVVATSTLDLGIDWGDVDLVIHVGAPKGASRLAQRIGRANHRMDEPSKGILVPSNRFEVLECRAALDANYLGRRTRRRCAPARSTFSASTSSAWPCAEPFDAVALYDEMRTAESYRDLPWETFERVVDFVATGGYALRSYERYAKIRRKKDGPTGLWAHHPSAHRTAIPAERRHDRRGAELTVRPRPAAQRRDPRRRGARQDRGIFPRAAQAGRHVSLRRTRAAVRGHPRERRLMSARRRHEIR